MSDSGMFDLTNKTAVVTGAGSGIGRAIALGYARAGAHVFVWGRDRKAEVVAQEITSSGGSAAPVIADLQDLPGATDVAERLAADHHVDILVNNAGVIERAPAERLSARAWHRVTDINLHSAWACSRAFAGPMLDRGDGRIISVASMLSFQGGRQVSAYAATKHAIVGLTRALASEWASRGIGVNAIAPGYVVTSNTEAIRANDVRFAQISERIPAGRWALPEDMVGPAIFLASDAARYVHGHVLAVDGGWLAA